MKVDHFDLRAYDYVLPEELIAQEPLARREEARLMVIHRQCGKIVHDRFANIARYLPPKSLLVLNDTRVIPARLFGVKESTMAKVEIFLLKKVDDSTYEVLMRPMRRLHDGERVMIEDGKLIAEIVDKENRIVRFNRKNVLKHLESIGHIPLPPYVRRPDTKNDRTYYQTVYAKRLGSVAAPTAGLHFTDRLMKQIKRQGHGLVTLTLHINYGTFKPVETPDIRQHVMHVEPYTMSPAVFRRLKASRERGRSIIAVGTTSCRVMESVARSKQLAGNTNLFIYPGLDFKMVDGLITNFHLPRSTLLMLVSTFGGYDLIRRAYQEAIKLKYRFYSYGDGMMIV